MKKLKFSMIEILVGIVVLTIMMAFLINAFTTAERIASTGQKGMDVFEKSNMALDFMSGEISQLTVNDSPRTQVAVQYGETYIRLIAKLPFTADPFRLHRITYFFNAGELGRTVELWDETNHVWETPTTATLMKDIEVFKFELVDEDGTMPVNTAIVTFPNYCEITFKLNNPESSQEKIQRMFTRRIFFK